ncbi:non-ribosomal peptide synthetase, partial [Dokdonia pacifica]
KHSISKFDMSFVFTEIEGQLAVHIDYNTDIYDPVFVEKIGIHLENFLNSCLQNADQSITDINFLTKEDTAQLLTEFNTTKKSYDINRTVIDVFVNQVNKTPDAIALVHEGKQFTYAALDTLSNQMAHYLLSNFELSKEDIVGIKLDRGEWLVISLLSVLKAGCAYVPIDPSYPKQRIEYIQVDSNCTITIDTSFIDAFNAVEHTLTSLPEIHISPSSLAYVIYTSGSTGKPKGVMIEHKSALNLSFWHIEAYHVTSSSRGTLYAGIGFDASVWEIYPYLLAGASLYPISDSEVRYDVQLLTEFLEQNEITHAYLPTKICEELVGQNISIERIKILTGGEALSLPKGALDIHIYNNYGPSENSVVTTNFDLKDRSGDSIPIGKPVSNTEIYIVSNTMQLQPVGVVGEICISGVGLSRGYLNRKELTEEKFVFNRFRESGLLYKTGDLGRWLPDGNIEFIGRKDSQVKIRGYRIELGEIENTLTSLAAINQAVIVVATVKETQALVAYYTSSKEINKQELRTELSNMLPDYMVPTYYVALDTIPLNANGKVDKKALPAIVAEDVIKNEYVAPSTDLERQLVAIWEEVLSIDPIGITDNFFELGGHSLKINLIVNKIKNELELSVAIKDIFLNPTIAGITEVVEEITSDSIPVSAEKECYVLTSSQRRLWTLSQFDKGSVAYTIFNAFEFKGALDIDSLSRAYIQLV